MGGGGGPFRRSPYDGTLEIADEEESYVGWFKINVEEWSSSKAVARIGVQNPKAVLQARCVTKKVTKKSTGMQFWSKKSWKVWKREKSTGMQ